MVLTAIPKARVLINGVPVAGFFSSAIASIRVTDAAPPDADTLELSFANTNPFTRIALPPPGAEVEVELGYLGFMRSMGVFVADEVEESSPPRVMLITGRSKPQGATEGGLAAINTQRTRSFEAGLTLGDIVATVAGDTGLTAAATESAAAIVPGHIDQVDESDMSMLTRVAGRFDLIAKPVGRHLFVGRRGDSKSATGSAMPVVIVRESDLSRWRVTRRLSETVGSVIALYRDLGGAADIEVTAGEGEPVRRLRTRFADEAAATAAAEAELARAGRAVEVASVQMPGNINVASEGRMVIIGTGSGDGEWLVASAVHRIDTGGYVTEAQLERPSGGNPPEDGGGGGA